jgi:coatomer beta-like protein/adaptin family protein
MDCVNAAFLFVSKASPEVAHSYACNLGERMITTDARIILSMINTLHDSPQINEFLPQLLDHKSAPVRFEVARILLTSKRHTHYESACKTILDLAESTPDNTVKAVIGAELKKLTATWEEPVFSPHLTRLTRVLLKTASFDIRSLFLEASCLFLDSDNHFEFAQFSSAEISRHSQNKDAKNYRHQLLVVCKDILVQSSSEHIQRRCVEVFMLALRHADDCKTVLAMIKEILAVLPKARELLTTKLCEHLNSLPSAIASALWIIGEYSQTERGCFLALEKLESFFSCQIEDGERSPNQGTPGMSKQQSRNKSVLLSALFFSVGKMMAVLHASKTAKRKEFRSKAIFFLLHVLKYCQAEIRLDKECIDRAWTVMNTVLFPERLGAHFAAKSKDEDLLPSRKVALHAHEIDSAIAFSDHLVPKSAKHETDVRPQSDILALTGHSDKIFAEVKTSYSASSLELDFLIVNLTDSMLENVELELFCSGDMEIPHKFKSMSIPAKRTASLKTSIKVTAGCA